MCLLYKRNKGKQATGLMGRGLARERERGLSLPNHWHDKLLSPSLVSLGVLMSEKEKLRARCMEKVVGNGSSYLTMLHSGSIRTMVGSSTY